MPTDDKAAVAPKKPSVFARKTHKLDRDQIKAFMRIKPSLTDTAVFFDVCEKTISRFIKKEFDKGFVEFREENLVFTRHDLIRTAINKAMGGDNCMLIFCLKNMCGWADKIESKDEQKTTIKLLYSLDEGEEELEGKDGAIDVTPEEETNV